MGLQMCFQHCSASIDRKRRYSNVSMNPSAAEFQPSGTGYAAGTTAAPSPEQGEEAVVNMLKLTFPSFSTRALRDLYQSQCHGSIEETVDAIFKIEAEVQGARLASAPPPPAAVVSSRQQQPDSTMGASQFSEEEFPSLGSGQSVQSRNTVGLLGGDFVSKVKSMPSQQQRQQHARMEAARLASSRQNPRPIWMAEKEVAKFDTGYAVAKEYAQERAEARDYARIRNSCFEEATKAYLSGDKKLAKELGRKGRMYNALMKESHEKAAMGIFASRNNAQSGQEGSDPVIDLHGLHVREAESILARALDDMRFRRVRHVDVVVGEGKHSKGGPAGKLRMAVSQYLDDARFKYEEQYSGLIRVYL